MSGVKQATLVTLYCTVCGNHSIIEEKTQHLLNHRFPKFSDEKCITAYLWGKKAADKRYHSSRKSYYDWQSLFAELVFFLLRKYLCSRKLPFLTKLLQNDVSESAISPQRLAVGGYACLHESAGNRPSSTPTTDVLLNKFHPDPTAGNAYGHTVFLRFWNFRLFAVSFCGFNHGFPDGRTENAQPRVLYLSRHWTRCYSCSQSRKCPSDVQTALIPHSRGWLQFRRNPLPGNPLSTVF